MKYSEEIIIKQSYYKRNSSEPIRIPVVLAEPEKMDNYHSKYFIYGI